MCGTDTSATGRTCLCTRSAPPPRRPPPLSPAPATPYFVRVFRAVQVNGTAVAVPRLIISILENFQQPDGRAGRQPLTNTYTIKQTCAHARTRTKCALAYSCPQPTHWRARARSKRAMVTRTFPTWGPARSGELARHVAPVTCRRAASSLSKCGGTRGARSVHGRVAPDHQAGDVTTGRHC